MRQRYCKPARPIQLALCARRATAAPMSSYSNARMVPGPSLRLLTATDGRPNFLLNAEISPLTEPAGPYQSAGISQSMSIRERV